MIDKALPTSRSAPSMASKPQQLNSWSKKLSLLIASVLAGLLLVEGSLRMLGFHSQSSWSSFTTWDPILGWTLRPNARGWNAEGETEFRINSAGYHDRERQIKKPGRTFRIAVIGDSFVEALQSRVAETFLGRVEQDLPRCQAMGGRKVEVWNFGVSGYGQAQELLTLRNRVWETSPDMVILSVYFGNDLFDNYRRLDYAAPGQRPYFTFQAGQLALDNSFRSSSHFDPSVVRRHNFFVGIMNHSQLLLLLNNVKLAFRSPFTEYARRNAVNGVPPNYVDIWPYVPPTHPYHKEAWTVTEELVLQIEHEVRAHNASFLALSMPMARQVDPDELRRHVFQSELGIDTLYYADERLRTLAQSNDFAYLALAGPLAATAVRERQYVTGGKESVRGEGHLNRLGHRLAGEALTRYLCENLYALELQVTREGGGK